MALSAASSHFRSTRRILIVEDEFVIALALEDMLSAAGYSAVGIAATFDEALALAVDTKPSLVLMDIRIASKRDGVDAAIEIYQTLGIRSLFTSANVDPDNVERAKDANPAGWLPKPYSPDALTEALDQAFLTLEQ